MPYADIGNEDLTAQPWQVLFNFTWQDLNPPALFYVFAMAPLTTAGMEDDYDQKKSNLRAAQAKLRKAQQEEQSSTSRPSLSHKPKESPDPPEVCEVGPFLDWLRDKKGLKDLQGLTCAPHNKTDPAKVFWDTLEFIRKNCGNVELKNWKKLEPHHTLGKNYGFIWLQFSGISS